MRHSRVMREGHSQRGFTMVELLVAIAIVGLISAGIATITSQIITGNTRTSNHMVAIRQVQQAGKDVSQDTLQSQTIELGPNGGFPLQFSWIDKEVVTNNITYTITEGNELLRTHLRDPGDSDSRVIARYIVAGDTTAEFGDMDPDCEPRCRVLVLTITASVGGGPYEGRETRIYEAERRPD